MYTEIVAGFSLRDDVPDVVVNALRYICGETDDAPDTLPEHALFLKPRWSIVGRCSSYYFGFSQSHTTMRRDSLDERWIVSIRASVKNYDGEVEAFFDWVAPYVEDGSGEREMIGYSIYEAADSPSIYYVPAAMLAVRDEEG